MVPDALSASADAAAITAPASTANDSLRAEPRSTASWYAANWPQPWAQRRASFRALNEVPTSPSKRWTVTLLPADTTSRSKLCSFFTTLFGYRRIDREQNAVSDRSLEYLNAIRIPDIEEIAEAEWRVHLTNLALQRIAGKFSKQANRVFRLSIDGMAAEEIARETGLTVSSVHTLKSRVRAHFTAELKNLKETLE